MIKSINSSICLLCPYDCYTCDRNSNCLTCNSLTDFRTFDSIFKRCIPLSGYFDINTTIAVKCPTNCSSCSSLTVCKTCFNGYLGPTKLCGDCPQGYVSNNATNLCDKCPYDCFTCNASKNCLSCGQDSFRTLNN